MMATIISYILMMFNLIFAMIVFTMITRPEKLLGVFAYFADLRDEWKKGSMKEEDVERLLRMASRWKWIGLSLLFGSSFFSGAFIAYLQIQPPLQ